MDLGSKSLTLYLSNVSSQRSVPHHFGRVLVLQPLSLALLKGLIHTTTQWKEPGDPSKVRQWEVQNFTFQLHPVRPVPNAGVQLTNSKKPTQNTKNPNTQTPNCATRSVMLTMTGQPSYSACCNHLEVNKFANSVFSLDN